MTTHNNKNEINDLELWGLFRSANERKNWFGIWSDVEQSQASIDVIEHYLWDSQPNHPSSERSLLYADLCKFLTLHHSTQHPRLNQIRDIWHERVMTAQDHYKQLGEQTKSIVPTIWLYHRSLFNYGAFTHHFDIHSLNLSFVLERGVEHGTTADIWYDAGWR